MVSFYYLPMWRLNCIGLTIMLKSGNPNAITLNVKMKKDAYLLIVTSKICMG